MSKLNNNSRKNTKNLSSKSKKASKKNFKIENLEPRLMMDAATGFDIEKIDEYTKQFESISSTVGDEVYSAVSSISEFNASALGITENVASFTDLLADSAESFKSTIVNNVQTVLNKALESVEQASEQVKKIDLADFVDLHVKTFLASKDGEKYKGLEFAANDSKLTISLDLSNTKSLEKMGFDIDSLGSVRLEGDVELSSVAKVQVVVDLNADNDDTYLNSEDDLNVESPVIQQLKASIDNLGVSAKFMDLNLVESTLSDETDPDISLSYVGSKFVQKIDLEFILQNSTNLPFSFAEGECLKITSDENGLGAQLPQIQMNENCSLADLVGQLDFSKISFLSEKAAGVAEGVKDVWANSLIALNGAVADAVKNADAAAQNFALNVKNIGTMLTTCLGSKWDDLKKSLADLSLAVNGSVESAVSLLSAKSDDVLNMVRGQNTFSFVFRPNVGDVDLEIASVQFGKYGVELSFAVEITLDIADDGKVSYGNPKVSQFVADIKNIKVPAGLPFTLDNNALSAKLVGTSLNVDYPSLNLDEDYSIAKALELIDFTKVPFLSENVIKLGDSSYSLKSAIELSSDIWSQTMQSVAGVIVDTAKSVDSAATSMELKVKDICSVLKSKAGTEWENVKKSLTGFYVATKVANAETKYFSLFDEKSSDVLNIARGSGVTLSFKFDPSFEKLALNLFSVNLGSYDFTVDFAIDIGLTVNLDGSISFGKPSVNSLNLELDGIKVPSGLPFTLNGQTLSISLEETGDTDKPFECKSVYPQIKFEKEFSLESVLNMIQDIDVPFLGNLKAAKDIALKVNSYWGLIAGSLYSSVTDSAKLNLNTLQAKLKDVFNQENSLVNSVLIAETKLADNVDNRISVFQSISTLSEDETAEQFMDLKENGETCLTFFVTPEQYQLKSLNIELDKLSDIDCDFVFAFDVVVKYQGGKISFERVSFREVDFSLTKDVGNVISLGGLKADVDNGSFSINASFASKKSGFVVKALKTEISYEKLTVKSGSTVLTTFNNGSLSYDGKDWIYPDEISNFTSLFDEGGFSLTNLLQAAGNWKIPVLNDVRLPIGGGSFTIQEIVTNVDSAWKNLSSAIYGAVEKVTSTATQIQNYYGLNLQTLHSKFMSYLGSNASDVKTLLASLNINAAGGTTYDVLLESADVIDLTSNAQNKISLAFNTQTAKLNNFSVYSYNVGDVSVDMLIKLDIAFDLSVDGKISNVGVSFGGFTINLKFENIDANLPISFDDPSNKCASISFDPDSGWGDLDGVSFDTDISVVDVLTNIDLSKIPYIGDFKFSIGNKSYQISQTIGDVKSVLKNTYTAIRRSADVTSSGVVDLTQLKSQLSDLLKQEGDLGSWLSSIKVVSGSIESVDSISNAIDLWGSNLSPINSKLLKGGVYTFVFALQPAVLDKFTFGSFDFSKLGFSLNIAVEITVTSSAGNTSVVPSLKDLSMKLDITSFADSLPVTFDGNDIKISLINNSGTWRWNAEIPESHLKDISSSSVISVIKQTLLGVNKKIPLLGDKTFSVGGCDITIPEVASKICDAWEEVSFAIYGSVENYKLNLNSVYNLLNDFTGIDSLKKIVNGISVVDEQKTSFELFNLKTSSTNQIPLKNDGSETKISLALKSRINLSNFEIAGFSLTSPFDVDVEASLSIGISIVNGKVALSFNFDSFALTACNTWPSVQGSILGASVSSTNLNLNLALKCGEKGVDCANSSILLSYDGIKASVLDVNLSLGNGLFGYDFSNNTFTYPSEFATILQENFSLQTLFAFAEKSDIPYLGKKLTLSNGNGYSVIEIAKEIDKFKTYLNVALAEVSSNGKLNVKKFVKNLKDQLSTQELADLQALLSCVKLSCDSSTSIDVIDLIQDSHSWTAEENKLEFDLSANNTIDVEFEFEGSQYSVGFYGFNVNVTPKVSVGLRVEITIGNGKISELITEFGHFNVSVKEITESNTKSLLYMVDSGCLTISIKQGTDGKYNFDHNVVENTNFSAKNLFDDLKKYALTTIVEKACDLKIPFLNKSLNEFTFDFSGNNYTLPSAIEKVQDYWTLLSFGLSDASTNTSTTKGTDVEVDVDDVIDCFGEFKSPSKFV